jgi:hypothetical protein
MTPDKLSLIPRPSPLPTDLHGWLKTFAQNTFFAGLSESRTTALMAEVEEICRPDCYWSDSNPGMGLKVDGRVSGEDDGWEVMYVRLRGKARVMAVGTVLE